MFYRTDRNVPDVWLETFQKEGPKHVHIRAGVSGKPQVIDVGCVVVGVVKDRQEERHRDACVSCQED